MIVNQWSDLVLTVDPGDLIASILDERAGHNPPDIPGEGMLSPEPWSLSCAASSHPEVIKHCPSRTVHSFLWKYFNSLPWLYLCLKEGVSFKGLYMPPLLIRVGTWALFNGDQRKAQLSQNSECYSIVIDIVCPWYSGVPTGDTAVSCWRNLIVEPNLISVCSCWWCSWHKHQIKWALAPKSIVIALHGLSWDVTSILQTGLVATRSLKTRPAPH